MITAIKICYLSIKIIIKFIVFSLIERITIIGVNTCRIIMSTVNFKQGDIVWVPSVSASNSGKRLMWPAKFLKQTNRSDICMVILYGTKVDQFNEQFLVDTQEIIQFDRYDFTAFEGDVFNAYELALHDFMLINGDTTNQTVINNAEQLCEFIQTILVSQYLISPSNTKQKKNIIKTVPKISGKQIPLESADVKLYFKRMIPQILSYLLKIEDEKEEKFKYFLEQTKCKIIKTLLSKVEKNEINLQF